MGLITTMTRRFILNEVSYFGPGARKELPGEVRRLGLHKALVCTDKDLIKFGVAQKVLDVLDEAGIPYEVFSEIKQNPTVKNVKLGSRLPSRHRWRFEHRHIKGYRYHHQQSRIRRCRFARRRG